MPECYTREFFAYCGGVPYGTRAGQPGFDSACDVDGDGIISIFDIQRIGANLCPDEPTITPPPSACLIALLFGATQLARLFPLIRALRDRYAPRRLVTAYYALSRTVIR